MPAMNAVEIADGQRDMALSDARKTPEYTHALARISPTPQVSSVSLGGQRVAKGAEDIEKLEF
jgi:hypothetical protein